jgi:hypothetical protein
LLAVVPAEAYLEKLWQMDFLLVLTANSYRRVWPLCKCA